MTNWESLTAFGGAGLSSFCFLFVIIILCFLCNVRKRLIRLERSYIKNTKESSELKQPLTTQPSILSQSTIRSNFPQDIDTIPIVPRRSEYIRQGKLRTISRQFINRVSRTFTFGNTSRSSQDTFDLPTPPEEPIYDDILQYRKSQHIGQNLDDRHYICCCCCKVQLYYDKARSSDPQTTENNFNDDVQKNGENTNIQVNESNSNDCLADSNQIDEIKDPPDKKQYGILTKKKKQAKFDMTEKSFEINVQHVEFDEREKCFQPTTSDDVTIVAQNSVKQINKENQLTSFGKKIIASPKLEKPMASPHIEKPIPSPKVEKKPPTPESKPKNTLTSSIKSVTIAGHGKRFQGIPLPKISFPIKPARSLPSVNEEVSIENDETTDKKEEKERDPSYIDMAETLKVPPLPEKQGKHE